MTEPPATVEVCQQPFNGARCGGIVYRPQPDLPICPRCGFKGDGVRYRREDQAE